MDARAFLQSGDLAEALAAVKNDVRKQPAEPKHRVFLFQLLCASGEWDRALNQLGVLEGLGDEYLPLVRTYSTAIQCEGVRAEVFSGKRSPLVFGDPEQWLALLLESVRLLVAGEVEPAERLRGQAFEAAPAVAGTIDDQPFQWIMDADPRFGPVCEAFVNGKYYWVPFSRISRISMGNPEDLRDLIWLPADFQWTNGGEAAGFIPVRYPGTESTADALLQLSRRTDWQEISAATQVGLGQRLLATDAGDYPLLDVRSILLLQPES